MPDLKRLVVVNDDPTQLRFMGRILESSGYEVRAHLDAADALGELAGQPQVDLFVVDLHMPGIDGWKLCRLLRSPDFAPFNSTPILIVSATFSGADVEAITADLGANAFLALPFTRTDLLEYVADLLEGRRPRVRPKVLVVEDDHSVRRAVSRAFRAHGFEVNEAETGEAARRLWSEEGADILVLDYHLPDVTCDELLDEFQSPENATVALIMTGDTDPMLPVRLLGRGADGYVRKPFDPAFLVELTRKAQRERSLLRVEAILEQRTQQLGTSEQRYRSLFDAIPDMVLVIGESDQILRFNEQVAHGLGHDPAALSQFRLGELIAADAALATARALDSVRATGSGSFETRLVRADRSRLDAEITAVLTEDDGRSAVLMVARDLSARRRIEEEQRRLQEQVQHAQRLESLGVLAGGIAHDFNNLLVGILGNASLALLDTPDDSPSRESIQQIETAAKRAAELTQQILTFSGRGQAVMKTLDVSELVWEMGQLLEPAVSKKARLAYNLRRSLCDVEGDASQVRQVVMNLIMNASDALGSNAGTIRIETSDLYLKAEDLVGYYLGDAAEPGPYVGLEVEDDGCGMDEQTQKQIFDPFFTTKFTGRGLGLAATLGIIRTHGGVVAVDSAIGRGTRFRVLLPASGPRERATRSIPARSPDAWTGGGTILIVDDEPAVRSLASAALRRSGFEVLEAADGEEGLRVLSDHPESTLVLLDLAMPELDGMQVLDALRQRGNNVPVLLSSGYTDTAIPAGTPDAGLTGFLRKPYTPRDLIEAAATLLRRQQLKREA